jgi:hypothetical protein
MTNTEIIALAREAAAKHGHTLKEVPEPATVELLVEFAEMVAMVERHACEERVIDLFMEMEEPYLPDICSAIHSPQEDMSDLAALRGIQGVGL